MTKVISNSQRVHDQSHQFLGKLSEIEGFIRLGLHIVCVNLRHLATFGNLDADGKSFHLVMRREQFLIFNAEVSPISLIYAYLLENLPFV